MKKEGKNYKITFKAIFIVLGVALGITVPLRIYQYFAIMDTRSTGFYDTVNWSVYVLYAVLAAAVIALIVLAKLSGSVKASRAVIRKNKSLAVGSFIMAAGIGYDVVLMLVFLIGQFRSYSTVLGISLFKYIFANGLFAILLETLCGIAACIYMVLFGLAYIDGKTTFKEYKLFAIMPLFWAMFRLVYRFMTKISFTEVSDLLFEMFMLAFMMLFFMSFARISADMPGKGEMRKATMYGLPAALLAILIGLTRFVVVLGGRGELLPENIGFSLAEPAFGVFAIIYLAVQAKYGRPASEDELIGVDEENGAKKSTDDDFLKD